MPAEQLHEPWRSFLREMDAQLAGPTEIHCLGGFVVAECYGLTRPTSDVDIIRVRGASDVADVQRIAGKGSPLAKKHRVYIDIMTVAHVPERYEERLIDVYAGEFRNVRVRVFERHDLALAKLGRNQDYDREDVRRLAQGPGLDAALLEQRYRDELRWQLAPDRDDLTLELWIEMITELRSGIERTRVDSSAIASIGYDEFRQILELEYIDGDVYRYFEVPAALHRALLDAPSIGQFVNAQVRDAFGHEKVHALR